MEGWVGLVGWPIADALPTKWSHVNHGSGVDPPATDRHPNHWATDEFHLQINFENGMLQSTVDKSNKASLMHGNLTEQQHNQTVKACLLHLQYLITPWNQYTAMLN